MHEGASVDPCYRILLEDERLLCLQGNRGGLQQPADNPLWHLWQTSHQLVTSMTLDRFSSAPSFRNKFRFRSETCVIRTSVILCVQVDDAGQQRRSHIYLEEDIFLISHYDSHGFEHDASEYDKCSSQPQALATARIELLSTYCCDLMDGSSKFLLGGNNLRAIILTQAVRAPVRHYRTHNPPKAVSCCSCWSWSWVRSSVSWLPAHMAANIQISCSKRLLLMLLLTYPLSLAHRMLRSFAPSP